MILGNLKKEYEYFVTTFGDIMCSLDKNGEIYIPESAKMINSFLPDMKIYSEGARNLGERAKDKYKDLGKEKIKMDIKLLTDMNYLREKTKELAWSFCSKDLNRNLSTWTEKLGIGQVSIFTAIAQLDLEEPGFIDDFPEAYIYVTTPSYNKSDLGNDLYREFDNMMKSFNRYSRKFDLKCIKNRLGIKKDDLELPESKKNRYRNDYYRADDYIALNIEKLVRDNQYKQVYSYLMTNFVSLKEDLMPSEYQKIIEESEIEVSGPDDINDLDWVEIFFNTQDKILETLDPRKYKPDTLKILNRIRLSGWK